MNKCWYIGSVCQLLALHPWSVLILETAGSCSDGWLKNENISLVLLPINPATPCNSFCKHIPLLQLVEFRFGLSSSLYYIMSMPCRRQQKDIHCKALRNQIFIIALAAGTSILIPTATVEKLLDCILTPISRGAWRILKSAL